MKLKNLDKLFEELREPIIFEDLELDSMYNFTYKVDKGVIYIWDKYYHFNIDLDETRAIMAFDMAEEFGFEYKESSSEIDRIFDKIEKALRKDLGKDFYLDWYTDTVLVAGGSSYKTEPELNENKTLTEGAINFTYSDHDLPTYVYNVESYLTDEEALQMKIDYDLDEDYSLDDVREWYETDLGYAVRDDYNGVAKKLDEANYNIRRFSEALINNLTDEEALEINNDMFYYPSENLDYAIDELTTFFVNTQAIRLEVWDGYYEGFSIGIEVDIDDKYELNKTSEKFIDAIIEEASKMLKEIATYYGMRRAISGGWTGPVYLEETKSKLNENTEEAELYVESVHAGMSLFVNDKQYITPGAFSGPYSNNGFIYKSFRAFDENEGICYIPEHAFDDIKPVTDEIKEYLLYVIDREVLREQDWYAVEDFGDSAYTKQDLVNLILSPEYNELLTIYGLEKNIKNAERLSEIVFEEIDWQYPETYLNEALDI